jgi:hypothetical protein
MPHHCHLAFGPRIRTYHTRLSPSLLTPREFLGGNIVYYIIESVQDLCTIYGQEWWNFAMEPIGLCTQCTILYNTQRLTCVSVSLMRQRYQQHPLPQESPKDNETAGLISDMSHLPGSHWCKRVPSYGSVRDFTWSRNRIPLG